MVDLGRTESVCESEYSWRTGVVYFFALPQIAGWLPALHGHHINDNQKEVRSKNMGHYWYLHNAEYPECETVIIFHKHKFFHLYHQHGRANSLQ